VPLEQAAAQSVESVPTGQVHGSSHTPSPAHVHESLAGTGAGLQDASAMVEAPTPRRMKIPLKDAPAIW